MKLTVNEFRYRDDNPPPRLLVTPIVPLLLLLLLFIFLFFLLLLLLLRIMTSICTFISYLRGPRLASFAWCRRPRRPRLEFTRVNGQKSFDRARNRGMQRFLNVLGDDDVGER